MVKKGLRESEIVRERERERNEKQMREFGCKLFFSH